MPVETDMYLLSKPLVALVIWALACFFDMGIARAQTIHFSVKNVALKSGETIEVGDVFLISADCRSLLTGTPEVEVMDGPPGVAVTIKQAMIVPRGFGCAKAISGGKLIITANEIEDYSHTRMILRIKYRTRDGDRLRSEHINVTLFP
jgi:hypothetical protein